LKINQDGIRRTAFDLLGLPDLSSLICVRSGRLGAIGETTANRSKSTPNMRSISPARAGILKLSPDEVLEIPEGSITLTYPAFRMRSAAGSN